MIADLDNDGEIAWTDFELFIEVIRAFNHLYMAVYVKLEHSDLCNTCTSDSQSLRSLADY